MWPLLLLAVLQTGCLAESELEVEGKCGPRDLTPECCLKQFPSEWERCTGSSEMARRAASPALKAAAVGAAAAVAAMQPQIGSAERRGVELAADLRRKVERAIEQCVRKADREVNDYHFNGRSPTWEICRQIKVGDQTTWAAYLGLFKHEHSWPCLHKALDELLPGRYRLTPRFQFDHLNGKWKFLDEKEVQRIVSEKGWKGLTGTIEPDIILLDEEGIIVRVYDLKFPCPETNDTNWSRYRSGPWKDQFQGDLYNEALGVTPILVSPREGVIPVD